MTLPTEDELEDLITSECHGDGARNTHEPEWVNRELSGSKLVKKSATDYALYLGRRVPDDDYDGRWGFVGNSACDAAYKKWRYGENNVLAPIPQWDWSVSMHCDAVDLARRGDTVVVVTGEGKNFEFNSGAKADEKARNALDQDALWLALAWHQVKTGGSRVFPLAGYKKGDPWAKEEFWWPPNALPGRCVAAFFPNHCSPRLRIERLELTDEQLDRHRQFFIEKKAPHILVSSEAIAQGMDEAEALALPGGALEWERTHGKLEFLPIGERDEPRSLPDVEALMQQYGVAKAAMKDAEAKETALRAALEAAVAQVAYEDGKDNDKWKHRLDGIGSVSWQPGGNVVERQASSYVSKPGIRFTPARDRSEVEA